MSQLKMPKPDKKIIANKSEILQDLKKILKSENILSHDDEVKPYETDALSAYKQIPMVVLLPENILCLISTSSSWEYPCPITKNLSENETEVDTIIKSTMIIINKGIYFILFGGLD